VPGCLRWGGSDVSLVLNKLFSSCSSKFEFYTDTESQVTCGRVSGKVSSADDNFSVQVQVKGSVSSYTFNSRVARCVNLIYYILGGCTGTTSGEWRTHTAAEMVVQMHAICSEWICVGMCNKGLWQCLTSCMVSVAPFVVPKRHPRRCFNVTFTLFFHFYRRKCLIISSKTRFIGILCVYLRAFLGRAYGASRNAIQINRFINF
jgi:hypothetical protein